MGIFGIKEEIVNITGAGICKGVQQLCLGSFDELNSFKQNAF